MANIIAVLGSIFILFLHDNGEGKNVYQIQFKSLNKNIVNMSAFKGKQVLITVFDGSDPSINFLRSLDTLYQLRKDKLEIIAIPLLDIGKGTKKIDPDYLLKVSLSFSYTITDVSYSKKKDVNPQHPLLQWATNKDFNTHFDQEVKQDSEIFIIDKAGDLFARLCTKMHPNGTIMQKILDNQPLRP